MIFKPSTFPVVFLSYDEPNYKELYQCVQELIPNVIPLHGVKGSDTAHKKVADLVKEHSHVVIIDGDNYIEYRSFLNDINILDSYDMSKSVVSYSGYNVINGNCYGNGGIKIWPVELLCTMSTHENSTDPSSIDFNLENYLELNHPASQLNINYTPLQAWRAGFREGVKLTLAINDWRNYDRLWRWMHVGLDARNGLWAIHGARLGCYLALSKWDTKKVCDFDYLNNMFLDFEKRTDILSEANRLGKLIQELTKDNNITDVLSIGESENYRETIPAISRSPEAFVKYKYNKPYDIVFAGKNDVCYNDILKRFPETKRVYNDNLHQMYIDAAKVSTTDYFYLIEDNSIISDNFEFDYKIDFYGPAKNRLWVSKNNINPAITDGVKLLCRPAILRMNTDTVIPIEGETIVLLSNKVELTDNYTAYVTGFREAVKLSYQLSIKHSRDKEQQLNIWCTMGMDKPFGTYAIKGAKAGKEYADKNKNNIDMLVKINDNTWMKTMYENKSNI